MPKCINYFKGLKIGDETALNTFLLSKFPYYEEFGDAIFSRTVEQLDIASRLKQADLEALSHQTIKRKTFTTGVDGEVIEDILFTGDSIGVHDLIDRYVNEHGEHISPQLIEAAYWYERWANIWSKQPPTIRQINPVTKEIELEGFTEEEIDVFFGGDVTKITDIPFDPSLKNGNKNQLIRDASGNYTMSNSMVKNAINIIKGRWEYQAKLGTAQHAVLGAFFAESPTSTQKDPSYYFERWDSSNPDSLTFKRADIVSLFDNLNSEYYIDKALFNYDDRARYDFIMHLIDMALNLKDEIDLHYKLKYGGTLPKLNYYVETSLSAKLSDRFPGQNDPNKFYNVKGRLDLLVTDETGNSIVIDFKAGNKPYEDFVSSKKMGYFYQLGLYNKMLQKNKIIKSGRTIEDWIVPIHIEDLKYDPGTNSYTFSKFGFSYNPTMSNGYNIHRDITGTINTVPSIVSNLNNLVLLDSNIPAENADLHSKVEKIELILFGQAPNRRSISLDETKQMLLTTDESKTKLSDWIVNGFYTFNIGNKSVTVKSSDPDAEEKFIRQVQIFMLNSKQTIEATTQKVVEYLLDTLNLRPAESIDSFIGTYGMNRIQKYANPGWELKTEGIFKLLQDLYGILIFESRDNENENIFEVIKLSSNTPTFLYKNTKKNLNDNLNFKFVTSNSSEESKLESLMLKAYMGNVEAMEVLIALNESGLKGRINDISILTPYGKHSTGLSARNKEYLYSWKTLISQALPEISQEIPDFKNNFDSSDPDNSLYLSSELEYLEDSFRYLTSSYAIRDDDNQYTESKLLEICQQIPDIKRNISKQEQAKSILQIIRKLEELYPALKQDKSVLGERAFSAIENGLDLSKRIKCLYILANKVYSDLLNIQVRLVTKASSSTFDVRNGGVSSTKLDNSGNFGNYLANTISMLIVNTTQQITLDLQKGIKENRLATKKLDEGINNLGISKFFSNPNERFNNMTYLTDNGKDVLFVNPYLNSPRSYCDQLSDPLKEYLKFVLLKINKLRFPSYSESLIIDKLRNDELEVLLVPLLPASSISRLNNDSFINHFKNKCKLFLPLDGLDNWKSRIKDWASRKTDALSNEELLEEELIFTVANSFNASRTPYQRANLLEKWSVSFQTKNCYETNLELILGLYELAEIINRAYQEIMPAIKAVNIALQLQGAINKVNFEEDLATIENLVKDKINNVSIDGGIKRGVQKVSSKLTKAASLVSLGFSPVLLGGLLMDGWIKDIKLAIANSDNPNTAYTKENLAKAFLLVSASAFTWDWDESMLDQINILFGINDMDLNKYVETNMRSKGTLTNWERIAFFFTSRPDFYNRMTLFVAHMLHDGSYEAFSFENKTLKYDCRKDKRFKAYFDNINHNSEEYKKAKALYYGTMQALIKEGTKNEDGSLLAFSGDDSHPTLLPKPYSNIEVESMKAEADNIYGYYDHTKLSLLQSMWFGGLIGQMKTYFSAKKNQYLGTAGHKNQVYWDPEFINEGREKKYLYYAKNESGQIDPNLPFVFKDDPKASDVQVMRLKKHWQEGIVKTMMDLVKAGPTNFMHFKKYLREEYKDDPDKMYSLMYNVKLFYCDFIGILISSILIYLGTIAVTKSKKEAKHGDILDRTLAGALQLALKCFIYGTDDLNPVQTIGGPLSNWDPVAFSVNRRLMTDTADVVSGDKTIPLYLIRNNALTRSVSNAFYGLIGPEDKYGLRSPLADLGSV